MGAQAAREQAARAGERLDAARERRGEVDDGWAAGSLGYGILVGAFVGVPAGVFAVYRRYRDTM